MSEYVASLLLTLNDALTKPLLQVTGKTGSAMKKLSESMTKMGTTLTNKVTQPLIAFGKQSISEFNNQEIAIEKLKNAVANAGLEANYNIDSFNKFASELQKTSNIADDVTYNTATLLTQLSGLTQASNQEVIPALADFSKALGMDMTTSARMASAYIEGTRNMFSRYGVQLDMTGTKEERIAKLTEALGNKFYGTAKTMAEAGTGPIENLKMRLGDFQEVIGKIIIKGVTPLINLLEKFATFVEGLDESTLQLVVTFAAMAAAIGPVMKGLGALMKLLSTGISPIQGILIAISALAAGYTIWNEWQKKNAKTHENTAKAAKSEQRETNAMAKEYEQLVNIQNPNLQQKKRLIELESTLKRRLGETSLELDKETGKWKVNTAALEEYNKVSNQIVEKETTKQIAKNKKKIESLQSLISSLDKDIASAKKKGFKGLVDPLIAKSDAAQLALLKLEQETLELEAQQSQAAAGLSGQVVGEMDNLVDEYQYTQDKIDNIGEKEETPMYRMKFNLSKLNDKLSAMAGQVASMPELAMSDLKTKIDTVLQERSMITVNLKLETPEGMKLMTTKVERSGNNIDLNITGPLGQTLVGV
ncbi:MAG: hypothetical protein PHS34_08190 [Candidatus Omnitrophica bacterium]|nr:hypothetical protein [Candidatus Omnitrophota bacterium]